MTTNATSYRVTVQTPRQSRSFTSESLQTDRLAAHLRPMLRSAGSNALTYLSIREWITLMEQLTSLDSFPSTVTALDGGLAVEVCIA